MLTKDRETESAKNHVETMVNTLRKGGYDNIKSSIDPENLPKPLKNATLGTELLPDATARINDKKAYFEVSVKTAKNDLQDLGTKWKLLSTLARIKEGLFRIYVPTGQMKFTQDFLERHNITAEIVKLESKPKSKTKAKAKAKAKAEAKPKVEAEAKVEAES